MQRLAFLEWIPLDLNDILLYLTKAAITKTSKDKAPLALQCLITACACHEYTWIILLTARTNFFIGHVQDVGHQSTSLTSEYKDIFWNLIKIDWY